MLTLDSGAEMTRIPKAVLIGKFHSAAQCIKPVIVLMDNGLAGTMMNGIRKMSVFGYQAAKKEKISSCMVMVLPVLTQLKPRFDQDQLDLPLIRPQCGITPQI